MNALPSTFPPRCRRGSAFVTVLLFTFLLLTLVASILNWSLSERRLNIRASYWMEARNAAEAVAEYGFAQIVTQFNTQANPPSFNPSGATPLVLPPTHSPMVSTDFFYGSHVDPTSLELIAGVTQKVPSSGGLYLIDSTDVNNTDDPLKGQYVYRQDIEVLAKATVIPLNGASPVTAYITEKVSVRGAALFANAIFYSNNDLELAPGPNFDIWGPVHVNGNLILSAQGTVETGTANYISFHGPVSASGDLYHAWGNVNLVAEGRGYQSSAGDGQGEILGNDPLNFFNTAGTAVTNLYDSTTSKWRDSTMGADRANLFDANGRYSNTSTDALTQLQGQRSSNFRSTASNLWGGNLQTSAMGVASYNPVGTGAQVGVDGSSNPILAGIGSVDALGNIIDPTAADPLGYGPHAMIEPPSTTISPGDTYYAGEKEAEQQKLSNQTGLYVQVVVTPGANGAPDTAVTKLYGWPGSAAAGDPNAGPNGGVLLGTYATGTTPNGVVSFIPYKATATLSTPGTTQVSYSTTASGTGYKLKTTTTTNGTLTRTNVPYNGSGTSGSGSSSFSGGSTSSSTGGTVYPTQVAALAAAPGGGATAYTLGSTTSMSNAAVTQAMYDQRQSAGINLVQVDMSALRAALNDTVAGSNSDGKAITDSSSNVWGGGSAGGYNPGVAGTTGWNGGVYVEVKTSTGSATQTSVALANAKVSSGSSLIPTVNSVNGLTVATNAPAYVLGNFNADGSNPTSSTSATTPDDGRTDAAGTPTSAEVPVAIEADAVTYLSPGYFGTPVTNGSSVPTTNGSTNASNSLSTLAPSASGSMEVAAAMITGITPTSNTSFSGGAHNLPRFLENWGSNTVAIRGSLVCMYKSKTAVGPWAQKNYSAPRRNWGFDVIFQNGHFPPLSPKVMSYRRVDFSDMPLHDTTHLSRPLPGYVEERQRLLSSY